MGSWRRFLIWLSMTGFGTWTLKNVSSRIDPVIFKFSGGRFTSIGPVVIPQLVLTTTGRRSGRKRDVQLVYSDIDGVVYIVASNFGGEHHPAWSYNLMANARASIQLRGKTTEVSAVQLSDEEKESVWNRLVANIPNYSVYRQRTDRNIQVYRLVPRSN